MIAAGLAVAVLVAVLLAPIIVEINDRLRRRGYTLIYDHSTGRWAPVKRRRLR